MRFFPPKWRKTKENFTSELDDATTATDSFYSARANDEPLFGETLLTLSSLSSSQQQQTDLKASPEQKKKVVIVGGGLSGLACGKYLAEAGHEAEGGSSDAEAEARRATRPRTLRLIRADGPWPRPGEHGTRPPSSGRDHTEGLRSS